MLGLTKEELGIILAPRGWMTSAMQLGQSGHCVDYTHRVCRILTCGASSSLQKGFKIRPAPLDVLCQSGHNRI
jgi:hypothetical protein